MCPAVPAPLRPTRPIGGPAPHSVPGLRGPATPPVHLGLPPVSVTFASVTASESVSSARLLCSSPALYPPLSSSNHASATALSHIPTPDVDRH
ncbi:hypothetical protein SCP_1301210 [Sparassis crispa]|uniref:Uncharacterized protein n=1 Tax=Sparassis crispa TaxID=139825 RepID=A0A401H1J0_9APHY|nr:hypothetical protein SCP_1301210 [Sparassis crispa]GBE88306.1 hypothetical protein SCP_1301210 [Sparassis crispa]